MNKEDLKTLAYLINQELVSQPATLSIKEFAERERLSPNFVRGLIKKGELPSISMGKLKRVNLIALNKKLQGGA